MGQRLIATSTVAHPSERVRWKPEGVNEAFVLDLDELFKPI
jgi:hypothetical protein